jgi:hypothetical protein
MAKRIGKKKPPPKCKAILLCDQVIVDALTGKLSVIGVFEVFNVPRQAVTTSSCTAFLQMTDGIGDYAITIEIHDLSKGAILAQARGPMIRFPDRRAKVNFFIPLPPMRLPHAGSYDFVVLADGAEIDRQQFNLLRIGGAPGDGTPLPE